MSTILDMPPGKTVKVKQQNKTVQLNYDTVYSNHVELLCIYIKNSFTYIETNTLFCLCVLDSVIKTKPNQRSG